MWNIGNASEPKVFANLTVAISIFTTVACFQISRRSINLAGFGGKRRPSYRREIESRRWCCIISTSTAGWQWDETGYGCAECVTGRRWPCVKYSTNGSPSCEMKYTPSQSKYTNINRGTKYINTSRVLNYNNIMLLLLLVLLIYSFRNQ